VVIHEKKASEKGEGAKKKRKGKRRWRWRGIKENCLLICVHKQIGILYNVIL
jgi:hypothetical protein